MPDPIYHIHGLRHAYQDRPVLEIDAWTIQPAAIVGLIGPNGSGKSTLLKLLGFIEKPTAGSLRYKGRPAAPFSDHIRFQVTLLTQEPYLMNRTVFGNVAYGLRLRGNGPDCRKKVHQALGWVGLDGTDFMDRPWYKLSGGEAQRVALAARLVLQPSVLLMDEPTASVDAASVQLIKDAALRARQQWGTTLVIASHDWAWLYEICDQVQHLFRGRFFEAGGENTVFGPWEKSSDGRWRKTLAEGQAMVVPDPPNPEAVAVISANDITVASEADTTPVGHGVLTGTISRMIHENRTGRIVVTVLVGHVPFTAKVALADLRRCDLFPGRRARVAYDPNRVKWA